MSKHNYFVKFLKKIYLSINNLLREYLNKLNFKNFSIIVRSNKVLLVLVAISILFLTYLLIPNVYSKQQIEDEIKKQVSNNFGLSFIFLEDLNYKFLPRPHFTSKNVIISYNQNEVSAIKKLKIYVSLSNLFNLEDMQINDLILENANFNLNTKNNNFFIEILNKNLKNGNFEIKDSNIFYRNIDEEVIFINKIKKIKYFYDKKNIQNTVIAKNEIFNIPYTLKLNKEITKKNIFSKLNLNFLKLQIENKIDFVDDFKKGSAHVIFNQNKSNISYTIKKKFIAFSFFDKVDLPNFIIKGEFNFNPFYSRVEGTTKKINLSPLFDSNSLLIQLLKTGILNNKNLNFHLDVYANKVKNYHSFADIFFNVKIQEGLIDLDNTKFSWNDSVNFKISNSLIYLKDNELILDGKLDIFIKDSNDIYKSLLTPKNLRTNIKKIELSFNYNFDQKILGFNDIKVNNVLNQNLNKTFKKLIFKKNKLQNKIYLKNSINEAITSYAG
jgi:hypothetical protein